MQTQILIIQKGFTRSNGTNSFFVCLKGTERLNMSLVSLNEGENS